MLASNQKGTPTVETDYPAAVVYVGVYDAVSGERPDGTRFRVDRGAELKTTAEHAQSLLESDAWSTSKKEAKSA